MENWFHGYKWPPADFAASWSNASPNTFPQKYWDGKLFALTVLGEFVQVPAWAGNPAWDQLHNELAGFLPERRRYCQRAVGSSQAHRISRRCHGGGADATHQSLGVVSRHSDVQFQVCACDPPVGYDCERRRAVCGDALQDGFQAREAVAIFAGHTAADRSARSCLRFQAATQLKPILSP